MSSLKEWEGRTFIINLAHRTDRRESSQEQMKQIEHNGYEFFDAYGVHRLPPERYYENVYDFKMSGWWGNKFSHYGVIELAKKCGFPSVLVFEDDVILEPNFNDVVSKALSQLEDFHWDWLQFGGNHRFFGGISTPASPIDGRPYLYPQDGLYQVSENLAKIFKMLTAHAYIARESVYDFILEHAIDSELSIDAFYGYEIHPRFQSFCVTPCMATQAPGHNDIGNVYSDYTNYIGD